MRERTSHKKDMLKKQRLAVEPIGKKMDKSSKSAAAKLLAIKFKLCTNHKQAKDASKALLQAQPQMRSNSCKSE
jgi:hypothetical protein